MGSPSYSLGLLSGFAQSAAKFFVSMRKIIKVLGDSVAQTGAILKVVLVEANKLKEREIRSDYRDLTITELQSEVSWIC